MYSNCDDGTGARYGDVLVGRVVVVEEDRGGVVIVEEEGESKSEV